MNEALLFIVAGLALLGVVLLIVLLRRPTAAGPSSDLSGRFDGLDRAQERLEKALRDELAVGRKEVGEISRGNRDEASKSLQTFSEQFAGRLAERFKVQDDRLDGFSKRLADLTEAGEKRGEALRVTVEQRLDKLREENTAKLEEMRKTVDEKLQGTLDARLGESFKLVSDRLEQVHKGLGEMQTLATGVGDLKRLMTNVKSRGTWGEFQLGAILEQILAPEQFETNVATNPHSGERVEFAVRVPRPGDAEHSLMYLPIDAKFPVEDYQRLLDAQEAADAVALEAAGKQLEQSIRKSAKDIAQKYISPPHTTDFGILFLPTEGLYAEVVRRSGLLEYCQRECRVCVAGPTTLAVILNALQIIFRSIAIQERSTEVWQVLAAVKTEFANFSAVFEKVKQKLEQATRSIDDAETRTRAMGRKLKSVESMPQAAADSLLELPGVGESGRGDADSDVP